MSYLVRKYKKEDKEEIFRLIEAVWGKDKAEKAKDCWNWKFDDNSNNFTDGPNILILEKTKKIVGLFSGLPVSLKIKGKFLKAFSLVDLMVHPGHKGRGILLMKTMLKGPYVLFGSPNDIAYRIWKRLDCFDVYQLTTMISPINFRNILNKKFKYSFIAFLGPLFLKTIYTIISIPNYIFIINKGSKYKDIIVERVRSFDEQIDRFWQEVSRDYDVIVVRDRKYLTWRFIDCPDKEYNVYIARRNGQISGYVVFRDGQTSDLRQGYIVDILTKADDKESLQSLIQKAVKLLIEKKVDLITCEISPYNKKYQNILTKNGFIFRKRGYKVIGFNKFDSSLDDNLKNPQNWFITKSDSDMDMT